MVEAYLELLELGYFEVTCAFEGLADEHVWKRPAEGVLSIGELAGHHAYAEATRLAGEPGEYAHREPVRCSIESPLVDPRFDYYPHTLATSPTQAQRAMTAEQVCQELLRVHTEAVAAFRARNPDLESLVPGWSPNFTYREFLKYAGFHLAYHTGQMYTVRHLLGEETPDN